MSPIAEIIDRIANLAEAEQAAGKPLRTLEAIRQAGYRIVKARDGDRYFLARQSDLQPLLVKLGNIAEVRFGIKTGANEFFYLEPIGISVAQLFRGGVHQPAVPTVRVQNGAGWQGELETAWLRPVIKSPRELKTLRVRLDDLRYLVFMPPDDVRQRLHDTAYLKQRYPKAYAYIHWGEGQGYHRRPTCAARPVWWNLGSTEISQVGFVERYQQRYFVIYNEASVFFNKSFYYVNGDRLLCASLNTSVAQLSAELVGRTPGGGGGPVDLDVEMAKEIHLPNPAAFTASQRDRLLEAFEQMASREVRSIFEELGYPKPNRDYSNIDPHALTLQQVRCASPDRYALDAVVFEVLGLSESERLAVYRSVVELVRNRLVKARSV